ncbi:hypothetical protein PG993_015108 [Apiospora rasikravindrae]|uniref:Uncharacterized protein n=1 Tax=Apiospora rasikravindrae TaxID=990691 RepID=A0ABR1RPM2_9PEZI
MHYLHSAAAMALLASSAVVALPNQMLRPRETDAPDPQNQPWVTVGDDGKPSTVTPVSTTLDGKPTVVSAAPNELTATVFTSFSEVHAYTRTGSVPAAPTATNTDGSGSFMKCSKPRDAPNGPFCQPLPWDVNEYRPGNTYYFTWDATWFKSSPNTTIKIQGDYINQTNGETATQAFESTGVTASWGYWAWYADRKLLLGQHALNLSISLGSLKPGGDVNGATVLRGPTILLSEAPVPKPKPVPSPAGPALYVGLPVIFGFAILCIFGVCVWNARHRRIELGNIMSRGRRHGYGGKSSRRNRMAGLSVGASPSDDKKAAAERVQLMQRETAPDGNAVYRDLDDDAKQMEGNHFPPLERPNQPRRDSDALGSLAGTPHREPPDELPEPRGHRRLQRLPRRAQKTGGREAPLGESARFRRAGTSTSPPAAAAAAATAQIPKAGGGCGRYLGALLM